MPRMRTSRTAKEPSDTPNQPELRSGGTVSCHDVAMAAGTLHRSKDRGYNVAFRLSREDRDLLRERAADAGLSVQAYLERVALGRLDATSRPPGPTPADDQKELPLTSG